MLVGGSFFLSVMFQPNSNPVQISKKNRTQKRLESPHLLDYQADRRNVKDKYGN